MKNTDSSLCDCPVCGTQSPVSGGTVSCPQCEIGYDDTRGTWKETATTTWLKECTERGIDPPRFLLPYWFDGSKEKWAASFNNYLVECGTAPIRPVPAVKRTTKAGWKKKAARFVALGAELGLLPDGPTFEDFDPAEYGPNQFTEWREGLVSTLEKRDFTFYI